ncbi:hypothetical protein BRADI_1g44400v3 [Brachypodium distachyon]|uniref:MINDY deubiquitinase domain-containing protein n=1 Tax=Brachypodium distachyon TaxID=15368 RepID=I1GZB1_BRADI|nr:hypothetical protein BRADI_1g44400v3 [Brachypodium distachyon]
MRQIDFFGHSTHIIYQDKNGPCPVICISNCLLLNGKIKFECDLIEMPMERLVHIVQDLVKECLKIKIFMAVGAGRGLFNVGELAPEEKSVQVELSSGTVGKGEAPDLASVSAALAAVGHASAPSASLGDVLDDIVSALPGVLDMPLPR